MGDEPMTIASLADVRPGDLFFTKIGGFIPGVFPVRAGMLLCGERVRIGRRSFDHVGIVTEAPQRKAASLLPNGPLFGYDGSTALTWPKAVQAMPKGAEEIWLRRETHWDDGTIYCRMPEDYVGQGSDAAAIARAMIGTPYSFLSYAALAAWRFGWKTPRLEAWINRRQSEPTWFMNEREPYSHKVFLPCEAICSVLADQAWSLAGKRVMLNTAPQCVTPGALAERLLWMPGVIWGGVGIGNSDRPVGH